LSRILTGLLVLVMGILVFLVLWPSGGYSKESAKRTQALSNARQCARSLVLYSTDDNGIFPYVRDDHTLVRVLDRYVKPYVGWKPWLSLNPQKPGNLTFNYSLAGVVQKDVTEPEITPLILDPFARRNPNYEWTFLSAQTDTHIKYYLEKDWGPYRARLSLKLPRHGKPLN